jgi:hypothetical protein
MQDAITYVINNADSIVTALLAVVGAASAVAAVFGKQDVKWLEKVRTVTNWIALNVNKAKNKE